MIPNIDACFKLMDRYQMLENIKTHSRVVAQVGHLIARGLRDAGLVISVEKTTAGALMHDIGKTTALRSGQDHAELGEKICLENHLYEIAEIVAEHVRLKNYSLNGRYQEKEIVYYADKRVNHDRIVDLDERLRYILERYGMNQKALRERIIKNFELCSRVEEKLFRKLPFTPDELLKRAVIEEIH